VAPEFDVGMSVAEVKTAASWMEDQGNTARKTIEELMGQLRSIKGSWWGGRAAEAVAKISQAETSIAQFHQEIKNMNQILLENVGAFEAFDQGG